MKLFARRDFLHLVECLDSFNLKNEICVWNVWKWCVNLTGGFMAFKDFWLGAFPGLRRYMCNSLSSRTGRLALVHIISNRYHESIAVSLYSTP